jgi:hypothetical protein
MAVTVEELFQGHTEIVGGPSTQAEITYIVRGATAESDVRDAINSQTPAEYNNLYRQTFEITERIDETSWKVVVRYLPWQFQPQQEPEPQFSFDTGGGTQHITQSLAIMGAYGVVADCGGAIGFDGENVAGVDITVPVYNFSETYYFPPGQVTQAYKSAIFSLTGTVCTGAFRGFNAGEVLFLGASGSRRGSDASDDWEITFKFAASPNRTGITVGAITGIAKHGWDYMEVRYAADVDAAVKQVIKKPIGVIIHKVYQDGNFAGLGIGN